MGEFIYEIIIVLMACVGAFLFIKYGKDIGKLKDSINAKLVDTIGGQDAWDKWQSFIYQAIHAVEEMSRREDMTGEQKKELATAVAQDFAAAAGVAQINPEIIGWLIDATGRITGLFGKKENEDDIKNS